MVRSSLIALALTAVSPVLSAPYFERRQLVTPSTTSLPDSLVKASLGSLAGKPGINQTFDYVVIGSGTSGSAIGVRLAEAGHRVAILEAGEFYELGEPFFATTPGGDFSFVGADMSDTDPLTDWAIQTTPQTGANGRALHYARGKCVGGSSALNFMIYQRGTAGSYQQWADAVDDQSYTFDKLQPYFKKSPNFTAPNSNLRAANATPQYNSNAFTSSGGPLSVSFPNYAAPFSSWVQRGLRAIGLADAADFNGGALFGSQYATLTIRPSDESRSSSEASYIQSALKANNPNLKLYPGAMASKIIFDSSKKATGVEVMGGGKPFTLNATKEVILSAGAFQSPQLLMLSGIGPAQTLKQFNIPVLVDAPGVGQNMWDHIFVGPTYRVNVDTFSKVAHDPAYAAQALAEYEGKQAGPLTSNSADYLGWEKVPDQYLKDFTPEARQDLASFSEDWPNIEYLSGAGYVGNFSNLIANQPPDQYEYGTILAAVVSPLSRGNVTLKSASINDLPIVNPNWLSSDTDAQVAVAAFKRAREAFMSSGMQPVTIGEEYWPGSQVQTDEEILYMIRSNLMTVWHASCTCKMGKSSDPMAVVDSQSRVFGVKNLRVVDASAFPLLPPGHPQSATYMLAEKIADLIV